MFASALPLTIVAPFQRSPSRVAVTSLPRWSAETGVQEGLTGTRKRPLVTAILSAVPAADEPPVKVKVPEAQPSPSDSMVMLPAFPESGVVQAANAFIQVARPPPLLSWFTPSG